MDIRRLASSILIGAGLLSPVTIAGAQTVANGPYYATPSWDQTLPASSRFIVLANFNSEAVLDRETGLVWWRSLSETRGNLFNAAFRCAASTVGARRGWRLPTQGELLSLFDPSVSTPPFLPVGHPFINFPDSAFLWSSTPVPGESLYFQIFYGRSIVGFDFNVQATDPRGSAGVLCVRSMG